MYKTLLAIVFGLGFLSVLASDGQNSLSNFSGLVPEGNMPKCFTTLSTNKYKEAKESISKNDSRFERKSKKTFYLHSNFIIDRILLSGKVVYGDPVTEYINAVADELLKDQPSLRAELQFFATKSQYTNAFATDQGIIFVNTGLIARMESEAELAYTLAHEISHFAEDHVINMHVEKDKMIKRKGKYRQVSFGDNYLNVNSMSQEHESEADEYAYEKYYRKSNYCLDEIDSVFHTLLYASMPFYEKPFSPSFFEDEYYRFPKDYTATIVDTVTFESILDRDGADEKNSSHPATMKRKKAIARLKIKESNDGRQKFILPKEQFTHVRNLCRMESIKQMMIDQEYVNAMFNCIHMLEEMPDNIFLNKTLASALYIYSRYRTENDLYEIRNRHSKQSTEVLQLVHFIGKLSAEELTVLAARYLIKSADRFGATAHDKRMAEDLFSDMMLRHKIKKNEFFTHTELELDSSLNDPSAEKNDLYYLNAFASDFDNPFFKENLIKYETLRKEAIARREAEERKPAKQLRKEQRKKNREKQKNVRFERRHGKSLGEQKLVVIDPFYYKFKPNSKKPLQLIESEQKQLRLSSRLNICATESPLDVTIINPKEFEASDYTYLKHLSIFNDWLDERLEFDSYLNITPYSSGYIEEAVTGLGTANIMWTGVVSERIRKPVGSAIGASLIFTYGLTLPAVAVWAFIPSYETGYFAVVFDVETGKLKLEVSESLNTSDLSGDFVNKVTYDTFHQIYRKKKRPVSSSN